MTTMAEGGALRASLERRFMKLATRAAGRWVEERKVSRRRKKRERCFECSREESRRE